MDRLNILSRQALSLLALIAVAACGSLSTEDVFLPPSTYPGVSLGEDGVAGINSTTRYSESAIKAQLPEARVATVQATVDGRVTNVLAAFAPSGLQMLRFENSKGRVGSIHVVSEDVPGPNGVRVGMGYQASGGNRMSCKPGNRTWVGMALCKRRGSNITHIYALAGRTSTAALRGEDLRNSRLTRMVWEP